MTFGELLFWIIIAIVAYFLLKVGVVILIIVIIFVVIYYIVNKTITYSSQQNHDYEEFQFFPVIHYYPDLQFDTSQEFGNINDPDPTRYHDNYWYMPIHNYYNEKQNGYIAPKTCVIPQSISEYCVNKHIQQFGDLNMAISKCTIPSKTSTNCTH
jgi:hypothetical protein